MKLALMTIALAAISTTQLAAMSLSEIRNEARFLTDRMGHELGLSNRQYEDVYEINFDFLYQANEVIDDVVYGYDDAIDYYYYLLDMRNEDLMYVLNSSQYRKFVDRDYFYRPIYMVGRTWGLRIWDRYTDRNYFYFGKPTGYLTYSGAHGRIHFSLSYYANRYTHDLFLGAFRLWGVGYAHHAHDGWKRSGQKKYPTMGSRPWSNAKNYEKSRKSLKEGFVNVPSRDANKRKVMINSEENRRTAMKSDTPIRKHNENGKVPTGVRNNPTGKPDSSVRNGNGSVTSQRNNGNLPSQRGSSVGTPSQRGSGSSSISSQRGTGTPSKPGSVTSQRSSGSISSQRSSSASSKSSTVTSQRSSGATSQRSSSVGSASQRSNSTSSSAVRSSSTSQRSSSTSQRSSATNQRSSATNQRGSTTSQRGR